jgi:Putative auto-transporter adhesin, head GIN domain
MNWLRVAAVVALCVSVAGCGVASEQVKGSGKVISENRTVSGYDSIALSGSGKIEIEQNGSEELSISADDNLLQYLTSEVKGSQLMLEVKSGYNLSPSKPIVFKVGVKNLKSVSCAGDTNAVLKGIHSPELKLDIAGSGDMSAEGTADHQEISIAGSGKYVGGGLKSKDTKINIAGSGDAILAVSDNLDVTIAGSGSIKYFGDPKIKQSVMGSGTIDKQ